MVTEYTQSNFIFGEVSPFFHTKGDTPQYANGLKECSNFIANQDGIDRRGGTKHIANTDSNNEARLIRFESNATSHFILVFTNLKCTIFKEGIFQAEITTPYITSHLNGIKYAQNNNTMILTHENYAPQELIRTNDTTWSIDPISFTNNLPAPVISSGVMTDPSITDI
jgi:hypothetical protein